MKLVVKLTPDSGALVLTFKNAYLLVFLVFIQKKLGGYDQATGVEYWQNIPACYIRQTSN